MARVKKMASTKSTFGANIKKMDDPFIGSPKKKLPSHKTPFLVTCRRLLGRESSRYPHSIINKTRKPPNKPAPATLRSGSKDLFARYDSPTRLPKFLRKCLKAKVQRRKGSNPKATANVFRVVGSAISPRRVKGSDRVLRPRKVVNYRY